MPSEIVIIPCLSDNYAYLIKDDTGVCLVDAPEAGPIIAALDARGWSLDHLLITHHHHDHVGGVAELRAKYGCQVTGPRAETDKLPPLDHAVAEGDVIGDGALRARVIEVPGHTLGHIAFYFPDLAAVFTADSLMTFGCGRVFEGTMAMMWDSLSKLAALPPETQVYTGHEYTLSNARFAQTIEPQNPELISRIKAVEAARAGGRPTVPTTLAEERATNPFLRATEPQVQRNLTMDGADPASVFAEIRRRKDTF